MKRDEKELIEKLVSSISILKQENDKFQNNIDNKIEKLESKIKPVDLEKDVLQCVRTSISKSIVAELNKYDSPLKYIVSGVLDKNTERLSEITNKCFTDIINTEDFEKEIIKAMSNKIARVLVSDCESSCKKITNELKNDPKFKAKMVLAISNLVEGQN